MAIAFVKNGGTLGDKTGTAPSGAITVPAGGHASGNLVLVCVTDNSSSSIGSVTLTDSVGGNTWTNISPNFGGIVSTWIYGSVLTNALAASATITVTFASTPTVAFGITSAEFSGVGTTEDVVDNVTTGASATPSLAITPISAITLIVGALGIKGQNNDSFTEDTDSTGGDTWHSLLVGGTTGGSATANAAIRAAYKITTSAAAQTYNPTITSRTFAENLAALQPTVTVPPNPVPLRVIRQAVNRSAVI